MPEEKMVAEAIDQFHNELGARLGQREQIGNWEIEINRPHGFVARNIADGTSEFHFYAKANGWITGLSKRNPDEVQVSPLNWAGQISNQPVLVDRESCAKHDRILVLKNIGGGMNESEMRELLVLLGHIKSEK